MYCKFCGNVLTQNTARCPSCGTKIDLTDGGQSFFEAGELESWMPDDTKSKITTGTPITRELSDEFSKVSSDTYAPKASSLPYQSANRSSSGASSKRKRNRRRSNGRFIIACIASVVVLALIVGLGVFAWNKWSEKKKTEERMKVTEESVNEKLVKAKDTVGKMIDSIPEKPQAKPATESSSSEEFVDILKIEDQKYVKLLDIVALFEYKPLSDYSSEKETLRDKWYTTRDVNGKENRVEIQINEAGIWGKKEGKDQSLDALSHKTVMQEGVIYVHAESFLENFQKIENFKFAIGGEKITIVKEEAEVR